MKKLLIAIFILSFFLQSLSEVVPKDVSPEVPEYGMIIFLVNNGIMDLKNGKFSGSEYVSRYEVARYLYNLIKFMKTFETMRSDYNGVLSEIKKINELLGYDKDKMDFVRISNIEKKIKKIENMIYEMEINTNNMAAGIRSEIGSLRTELGSFKGNFDRYRRDTSNRFEKIEKRIDEIFKGVEAVSDDLSEKIKNLQSELSTRIVDIENTQKVNSKRMDELEKKLSNLENQANLFKDLIENSEASKSYIEDMARNILSLRNEVDSLRADMNLVKEALGSASSVTEESTPKLLVITDRSFKPSATVLRVTTPASIDMDELAKKVVKLLKGTRFSSDSSFSKALGVDFEKIEKIKDELDSLESSLSSLRENFESSLSNFKEDLESSLTGLKEDLSSSLMDLESSVTKLYEKVSETELSSEDIDRISKKVLPKLREEFKESLEKDLEETISRKSERKFEEMSRRIDNIDRKFTVQTVVMSILLGLLSIVLFLLK